MIKGLIVYGGTSWDGALLGIGGLFFLQARVLSLESSAVSDHSDMSREFKSLYDYTSSASPRKCMFIVLHCHCLARMKHFVEVQRHHVTTKGFCQRQDFRPALSPTSNSTPPSASSQRQRGQRQTTTQKTSATAVKMPVRIRTVPHWIRTECRC